MMIFTGVQLEILRARARRLLADLTISQGLQQSGEYLRQMIEDELKESCSMGHAIAFDVIRFSPWEYAVTFIDAEVLNDMSQHGWEPLTPTAPDGAGGHCRLIWRRRKLNQEVKHDK